MTIDTTTTLCWCGHARPAYGHTYELTPGRTYCLPCYWGRYPYRARGFEADIHDFAPERATP